MLIEFLHSLGARFFILGRLLLPLSKSRQPQVNLAASPSKGYDC